MDTEKLKNITSSIQSIVVAIGILCTGIWAIYVFTEEKIESLDINLSASLVDAKNNDYVVQAMLFVKNDGNKLIKMNLGEKALVVTKIEFDETGNMKRLGDSLQIGAYGFLGDGIGTVVPTLTVYPNSDKKFTFLFRLKEPGYYFIELFSLDIRENLYWIANTYLSIK